MVSNWTDGGQEVARRPGDRPAARERGRLAGTGVVEVDGARYTADHVVLANGADPIVPPIPGLAELDGVWGTREATSMREIPRRLIVLGGGPAGVELAQVVRRFGGEVVLVEGADHLLAREPAALGEALGGALREEGMELAVGVSATAARRDGDEFVLELGDGRELRGDDLLVATGRRPRVEGIGLESVGVSADHRGIPVDTRLRAGERLWAIGDVNGDLAADPRRRVRGGGRRLEHPRQPREAHYEAVPRVTYTDPQAAAVGTGEAPVQRHRRTERGREDRHVHPRVCRDTRLSDAAQRR